MLGRSNAREGRNESPALALGLGALLLLIVYLGTSYSVAKLRTRLPYSASHEAAQAAIFEWIRATSEVPKFENLPNDVQEALAADERVSYSGTEGLNFDYGRGVPMRVSLAAALSFGIVPGAGRVPVAFGQKQDPDTLIHNAMLPSAQNQEQ